MRAGTRHTTHPKRITEPLPAPTPAAAPRPLPDDGWHDDLPDDIDPDWHRKLAPTQKPRPTVRAPVQHTYPDEPPF